MPTHKYTIVINATQVTARKKKPVKIKVEYLGFDGSDDPEEDGPGVTLYLPKGVELEQRPGDPCPDLGIEELEGWLTTPAEWFALVGGGHLEFSDAEIRELKAILKTWNGPRVRT